MAITMKCSSIPDDVLPDQDGRARTLRTQGHHHGADDRRPRPRALRVMSSMMMKIRLERRDPAMIRSQLLPSCMSLKAAAVPAR